MIEKNGVLIGSFSDPSAIMALIPHAKHIRFQGQELVLVPHGLQESHILKNLGASVTSPIRNQYLWPGRFVPMSHQKDTAEFLTLNKRAFCLNEMGCVDSESEYLSPTGWKKISEYDGGKVAQYNRDTGVASFVTPNEYIKKPCENMLRFKNTRGVDQLLSPEHRVLYVSSTGTTQVASADSIYRKDQKSVKGWSGRFITTFGAPKTPGLALTDKQLRVMVAVIADGHFGSGTAHCVVRLKKERKILRLRALLDAAGITYKEQFDTSESGYGFAVFTFNAPMRHKDFSEYWTASEAQLAIIADEVFYWDGSERKADASDFSTYIKASADFIQYACAATGRTASLNSFSRERRGKVETEYVVHARAKSALLYIKGTDNEGNKLENIRPEKSTDGFKYCFSVPNTFWVMRRNGNIVITGNTGKTGAALWAADYLLDEDAITEVLVICPLSVVDVWVKEAFAIVPHRAVDTMVGNRDKRLKVLAGEAQIKIINFDGLKSIADEVMAYVKNRKVLIIVDEAATYRTYGNKRYKALRNLITPQTWLWLMTGTPTPNAPTDAWALAKLVNPTAVPNSYKLFQETVMKQCGPYKWVAKPGAEVIAHRALQPAIRFLKKDCLELPPLTYNDRMCELTHEQKIAYDNFKKKMLHEDKEAGITITAANAAVRIIKLQQVFCGVVKDDDGVPVYVDNAPRLALTEELIEEAGGKAIIFSPFIFSMEQLQEKLGKRWNVALVNGQTPKAERNRIFEEFQNGTGIDILIAHPATTAHGLTLTAASTIIWYAPTYSIELYEQANARIDRKGQVNPCTVYHIGCHPLEWAIYEVLQKKSASQGAMLALYDRIVAGG